MPKINIKRFKPLTTICFLSILIQPVYAFDHQHKLWHSILQKNIHVISEGTASQVDYSNIKKNTSQLKQYLKTLSAINNNEFQKWSINQQKAFLINAYNAFTIQLVISRYPDIKSIKDIGSWFSSPWKKKFFVLLNKERSLDDLEHTLLLKKGQYDDPLIHVALVCASKGCPALRNKAYTPENIEQLLSENMRFFLSDKTRNRYDSKSGTLAVSKIFSWYESDFNQGYWGIFSLNDLFSLYSEALSNKKEEQTLIQSKNVDITYLEYDWSLNNFSQ
ncbi:MAG: DUF547 domain-containing protein [gamma proteobacterium symbiont of Lucinoma myriamae]|nr:DUF547 domain-containing protein [gamma proteobacterium symbiont of Lucinoma myriamae]MCU7817358.1 DUF547 domain-containing protein [gamma proteobacterium symbiont of Lucinoma myriamae]MCU7832904.1 DUF547 domain-containing protein [gamma proteobacterium symbiont of Lucinoma myriamae]